MNKLYEVLDLYLNHFVPSRKCLEKIRIGSKYQRQYDIAKTPYQRVLEHLAISQDTKDKLRIEHEKLNPLLLKQKVDTLITQILTTQRNYGNRT